MIYARFLGGSSTRVVLVLLAYGATQQVSAQDMESRGSSKVMRISQQDVVDSVLEKSLDARAIELNAEQSLVDLERAKSPYDISLLASTSYSYSEAESITGLSNPLDRTLKADWAVQKATYFGTVFGVGYQHLAQNSILSPIVTSTRG